jgi:uncharacterized protein
MLIIGILLSLVVGLILGMLGGGGAILTLPMLLYVLRVPPKDAIASSLIVVGTTSLVSMVSHARAGYVEWRIGALFGGAAMASAFIGGRLAAHVPAQILLVGFGAIMVAAAAMMMKGRKEPTSTQAARPLLMLGLGALVGVTSGLVGAGGGFLIVPALMLLGGLPMRQAIATSLFVISMQSAAGFLGHVGKVHLDLPLVAGITGAAVVGSLLGIALGKHVPVALLRRGFAWLVFGMGLLMFFKQLPFAFAASASVASLVGLAFLIRRESNATSLERATRA